MLPPLTDEQVHQIAALLSLPLSKVNGDRAQNPAPASDFNRIPEGSGRDALVVALTEYGRITVSAEEADRQLRQAYPDHRIPGTAARARSQDPTWIKPVPSTEAITAEMREALDRLREVVGE